MSKDEKDLRNTSKNGASIAVKEITADGSFNRQKNRFTTPFGLKRKGTGRLGYIQQIL